MSSHVWGYPCLPMVPMEIEVHCRPNQIAASNLQFATLGGRMHGRHCMGSRLFYKLIICTTFCSNTCVDSTCMGTKQLSLSVAVSGRTDSQRRVGQACARRLCSSMHFQQCLHAYSRDLAIIEALLAVLQLIVVRACMHLSKIPNLAACRRRLAVVPRTPLDHSLCDSEQLGGLRCH